MVKRTEPKFEKIAEKADWVRAIPFKSPLQTPVTKMVKPVRVQIINVSIKVPVIEIKSCSTGSFVLAAAAAIGAEPRPDSLEKTPRATPFWIAIRMLAPAKPPTAATGLKAEAKIRASVAGIFSILKKITIKVPRI